MGAMALFRGAQHVCVAVNGEFAVLAGDVVGVPARERFVDAESRRSQAVMDAVFEDGIARSIAVLSPAGVPGVVTVMRVNHQRRVFGVATDWTPLALGPTSTTPSDASWLPVTAR